MSEWGYIVMAYGVTWAGLVGYAAYVTARARRAERALRRGSQLAGEGIS